MTQTTHLPTAWWGIGLEPWRPDNSTYMCVPYEDLPPAPPLTELLLMDFLTLEPIPEDSPEDGPEVLQNWWSWLSNTLNQHNLPLPRGSKAFFSDLRYIYAVPSCTDCHFLLLETTHCSRGDDLIIPFYQDSQGCLCWSLHYTENAEPTVIVSFRVPGLIDPGEMEFWHCAESFAQFIWRWWIENTIWWSAHSNDPLEEPLHSYIQHLAHPQNP